MVIGFNIYYTKLSPGLLQEPTEFTPNDVMGLQRPRSTTSHLWCTSHGLNPILLHHLFCRHLAYLAAPRAESSTTLLCVNILVLCKPTSVVAATYN